jgi:hypothetical protein
MKFYAGFCHHSVCEQCVVISEYRGGGSIGVLNLVKLAEAIALCTIIKVWMSFSALLENLANFDCRTTNQQDFLSTVRG